MDVEAAVQLLVCRQLAGPQVSCRFNFPRQPLSGQLELPNSVGVLQPFGPTGEPRLD